MLIILLDSIGIKQFKNMYRNFKSKKNIMRLIGDIQHMPTGRNLVRKKVNQWRSLELSDEDEETIDGAVFRANKRILNK